MAKVRDFRPVKDSTFRGLAAPGASHRIDQRVVGNPNVFKEAAEPTANANYRKKGGRITEARKHLAAKQIPLHGVANPPRQDRQSRRARGGRDKQKGVGGLGHLLILLPHHPMMGAPVDKDAHNVLHHAKHRHEVKSSPHASSGGSYANGGCVSQGESLADVRRRTARD
jgi:hypothetical protein